MCPPPQRLNLARAREEAWGCFNESQTESAVDCLLSLRGPRDQKTTARDTSSGTEEAEEELSRASPKSEAASEPASEGESSDEELEAALPEAGKCRRLSTPVSDEGSSISTRQVSPNLLAEMITDHLSRVPSDLP